MSAPMFKGAMHFAWLPVMIERENSWVWLDWVYREVTTFSDGTKRIRFYR